MLIQLYLSRRAANKIGVGQFWSDGSKLPSLTQLLEKTLEYRRDKFCDLILGIVQIGLIYRNSKSNPINREEIKQLNEMLVKVKFKIPDLWDPAFLDSLPVLHSKSPPPEKTAVEQTIHLKDALIGLFPIISAAAWFCF